MNLENPVANEFRALVRGKYSYTPHEVYCLSWADVSVQGASLPHINGLWSFSLPEDVIPTKFKTVDQVTYCRSSLFSFFFKFPLTWTNYKIDYLCFEYEIMLLMSMIMVVRTNYCSDKDDIGNFWWYDWCCYCCCMVETSKWQKDSEMVGLLPRWHQPSTSSNIVYLNLAFEFNN